MRESFVMYASQYDALENLTDAEIGQIIRKLFLKITRDEEYTCDNKLVDGIAKSFFPNIYAASKRYEASVNNGKKGGAPKGNQNAKKQPKTTQEQPTGYFEDGENSDKNNLKQPNKTTQNNLNDNDNVNDNVNENSVLPEVVDIRSTNNNTHSEIKEKEEYDVTCNTGNKELSDEEFEKWCYGCIDKFKGTAGFGLVPTVRQILGFMLDNKVGFYKSFFESYPTDDEGKIQIPLDDMNEHLYQLIQPMASYGYSISDNSEVLSKFNRWYVKSRINERNIELI